VWGRLEGACGTQRRVPSPSWLRQGGARGGPACQHQTWRCSRAAYQAYVERGDLDVFHRTLDPDIEWRLERGQLSRRDEVMAVIQSTLTRGVAVEVPPHVDAGDKLVLCRARCRRSSRRMPKGCFKGWRSVTVHRGDPRLHPPRRRHGCCGPLNSPGGPPTKGCHPGGQRERSTLVPSGFDAKGHSGSSRS
jgi:hypothetical protein